MPNHQQVLDACYLAMAQYLMAVRPRVRLQGTVNDSQFYLVALLPFWVYHVPARRLLQDFKAC